MQPYRNIMTKISNLVPDPLQPGNADNSLNDRGTAPALPDAHTIILPTSERNKCLHDNFQPALTPLTLKFAFFSLFPVIFS